MKKKLESIVKKEYKKRISKETMQLLKEKDIAKQITPFKLYLIGNKSVYGYVNGSYQKLYEVNEYEKEAMKEENKNKKTYD